MRAASSGCGSRTPTRAARSTRRRTRSRSRSAGSASTGTARSRSSSTAWSAAARRRSGSSPRARPTRTRARSACGCPTRASTAWDDLIRGRIEYPNEKIEDLVLVRADGRPTYNFASPVEDWLDGITHVLRGDDHISNTPKQIQILEALGAPLPEYGHLANILGTDGKKLSKRHGATSVEEFRDAGVPPGGARQLPRAPRLELRRQDDGHVARRARRAVHARARRREPRRLRLPEARVAERRLPARAPARRVRRPARRVPARAGLRLGRGARAQGCAARPGEDRDARRVPGVRRLPLRRRGARPGAARRRRARRRPSRRSPTLEPFTAESIEQALRGARRAPRAEAARGVSADPRRRHRLEDLARASSRASSCSAASGRSSGSGAPGRQRLRRRERVERALELAPGAATESRRRDGRRR